ncbi:MAG: hypothetical protein RJB66_1812 [Pseudomonadota bacterium]|jgi:hypothetical protein
MKYFAKAILLVIWGASLSLDAAPVEISVKLSPAGSFVIKGESVEGSASVQGNTVKATSISIPTQSLKTGINLRDKHMLERLESDKYPTVTLLTGEGSAGQGKGTIKIKNIEKPISGTYSIEKDHISAQFKLNLSDFAIEKIRYLSVGVKDEVEVTVLVPIQK